MLKRSLNIILYRVRCVAKSRPPVRRIDYAEDASWLRESRAVRAAIETRSHQLAWHVCTQNLRFT